MDIVSRLKFLTNLLEELLKNHRKYEFNLHITADNFLSCTEEKSLNEIWPSVLTLQKKVGGKLIGISNFSRDQAPGLDCANRDAQYPPFAPVIYYMKSVDGLPLDYFNVLKTAIEIRKDIFMNVQPKFSCLSKDNYLRLESAEYWTTRVDEWLTKWKDESRAILFTLIDLYGIALCLNALFGDINSSRGKKAVKEFCFNSLYMNWGRTIDSKSPLDLMKTIRDYEINNVAIMTNMSYYRNKDVLYQGEAKLEHANIATRLIPDYVVPYQRVVIQNKETNLDTNNEKKIARFLITGSLYYYLMA